MESGKAGYCIPSPPWGPCERPFTLALSPPGILVSDLSIPFPAGFLPREKICNAAFMATAGPHSINITAAYESFSFFLYNVGLHGDCHRFASRPRLEGACAERAASWEGLRTCDLLLRGR